MIVWRGYGLMLIVAVGIGFLLAEVVAKAIFGDPLPLQYVPAKEMAGMWLGAALLLVTNLALEHSNKPRTVIDKETGVEIVLKAKNDFFFIPLKYWTYILLVFGVIAYFKT